MALETDYLIVGAGAMGMAFADVLLTESDATVTIVDRRGRPGGHWNDAYPFVRLHQPSSFYGVNSRALGSDTKDAVGWNAGLYELASGSEVVAYFDQVMNQQFLPSGRVRYFPMSEYAGDGRFRSLISGDEQQVTAGKVVDATYMNVTVPSTRPPTYEVAQGVTCVPLNELPRTAGEPSGFVIVGAGKTAMDAILWLLAAGADPDSITWIMPRDSWLLDRARIQPGAEFAKPMLENFAGQILAAAEAESIDDLFDRLEAGGQLLRLDPSVRPTMYRCATVTKAELEQLRRVQNVVRLGRVRSIGADEIVLDQGTIPTSVGAVHVDCTADGLERRPVEPVFAGDRLTLQTVRTCQQVFSAAFVAHVEIAYDDEALKNELCTVVPHPNSDIDWLRCTLASTLNGARWRQDSELQSWLNAARLDAFSGMRSGEGVSADLAAIVHRQAEVAPAALARLVELIATVDP